MRGAWFVVVMFGCSGGGPAPPASTPVKQSAKQVVKTSATLGCAPLETGRCYQRGDCSDGHMCVDHAPGTPAPASTRMTGMGKLFGTDDKECDRRSITCPAGETANHAVAANLCPIEVCKPTCTATSCAADERCDRGVCRAIGCAEGWSCLAKTYCQGGMRGSDKHGCTPACPSPGYCQPLGPPVP